MNTDLFSQVASNFVPVFFRALGLLLCLPFEQALQYFFLRMALAFGLTLLVAPLLTAAQAFNVLTIPTELLLGFVLGLPLILVVNFSQSFGEVFDIARGQNVSDMYDPLHGQSSSYMAVLFQYLSWSSLLLLGILELVLSAFFKSFEIMEAGGFPLEFSRTIGLRVLTFTSELLLDLSFLLLPLLTIFLLVEIAFAFLSKVLTKIPLQPEAMMLKTYLGLIGLLAVSHFDIAQSLLQLAKPALELIKI